jgi:hypothetical protein
MITDQVPAIRVPPGHARWALDLAREIGTSWDEAHALTGLGRCALAAGNLNDAQAKLRQAQETFQRIGAVLCRTKIGSRL